MTRGLAGARGSRRMTLLSLVGALYMMVSGGPYALEELARDVGFGPAIVVLLAVPLFWSVPTALMVGELASALPEEGGYYAWVRRALGPFWGFQEAWLSLVASVFDMALYPTFFTLYLTRLVPALGAWPSAPIVTGALVIATAAVYNVAGARAVGNGSAAMAVLLMGPFAVMVALAVFGHSAPAAPFAPHAAASVAPDLAGAVVVAMWNYMGWDNASTVAGEVERPQRTYPRAVLLAVGLVAITYVVPFAAMRLAGVDPSSWDTGAWADEARALGGTPLGVAVVVGGMLSAFGMCAALSLSYSRLPLALAEDGFLPRDFASRRTRRGVPWLSVLACAVVWSLSLGMSFERLVTLDIVLYGSSLLLEFVALVALRLREPALARPFRVPGGLAVAVALGIGPLGLLGFALAKNASERVGPMSAPLFAGGLMLLGPLAYVAARRLSPSAGKTAQGLAP
jgi:amino acid transporter